MKKLVFLLFIIIFPLSLYAQNITDYFPISNGSKWMYLLFDGSYDIIDVAGNTYSERHSMHTYYFRIASTLFPRREGGVFYGINNNSVYELVAIAIGNGRRRDLERPYNKILGLPGDEWTYIEEPGVIFSYKASRSSISFDNRNYNDCILVERRLTINGILENTYYFYYARNIGLVYARNADQQNFYQKLIEHDIN